MTAQVPDSILWNGAEMSLHVLPLNVLFAQLDQPLRSDSFSSANTRGYCASWEIRDRKLFLVGIRSFLNTGHGEQTWCPSSFRPLAEGYKELIPEIDSLVTNATGMKVSNIEWRGSKIPDQNGCILKSASKNVDIAGLLNGEALPLAATWYSGLLRCSYGEMLDYAHAGFLSEYEYDLVLHIESGVVERSWTIDNRPGYEARKKLSDERACLFSEIYESDTTESTWKNSPAKAVTTFSSNHGNKLSEAIHHTIMQYFAQSYEPSLAGSEKDRSLRLQFDSAALLVSQAHMVASTLLDIQERGKVFAEMDIGDFLETMRFDLEALKHADDVMSTIELPTGEYVSWAEKNLRNMDELVAQGEFKLLGFCHGILWKLVGN